MRRWVETAAVTGLFVVAAAPFAALFPDPAAFGPAGAGILVGTATFAMIGAAFRTEPRRRRRLLTATAILLGITVAATVLNVILASTTMRLPTADLLVRLFGLEGEKVDDAVLYERWVELWLAYALVAATLIAGLRRPAPDDAHAAREHEACLTLGCDVSTEPAVAALGCRNDSALARRMRRARRRAARRALDGRLPAPGRPHDRHDCRPAGPSPIRFTTSRGTVIEFTQNGGISRPLGAAVPVAYLAADPAGTARADTIWANWSDVLGMLWIGGGFTLFPFYGMRAAFRPGRW